MDVVNSQQPRMRTPVVLACLLFLAGVQIIDLFRTPVSPFTDVPYHLAAATIVKEYGQPGNPFERYFALELFPKPNVLHLLFCSLPIFSSPETANRVYFALYYLLLPLSVFVAIRVMGGNTWFALLSIVYSYNFSTHWGFVGYVFGLPLLIFFTTLLARHRERPTPFTAPGLSLLAAGMFFVHVLLALLCLAILLATSARDLGRAPGRAAKDAALGLPLLALVIAWWWSKSDTDVNALAFLADYYSGDYWIHWPVRLNLHRVDHMFLLPGDRVAPVAWLLTGLALWPLGWALLGERERLWTAWRSCPPALGWLLLAGLAGWLLMPTRLPGLEFAFYRFSVVLLLAVILFQSRIRFARLHRLALPLAFVLACGLHAFLYADYFSDFRADSADLTPDLFPEATRGPLGAMVFSPRFRGGFAYVHAPNYFTVWKKGVVTTALADFKYSNVRRKADLRQLPPYNPWIGGTRDYDARFDELDTILVQGDIPEEIPATFHALFEEVKRSGTWALYRRRESRRPDPSE